MLKVYMTGLVYIHGCNATTPLALLPDGTGGGDHCASLWADKDTVDSSSSWPVFKEHDLDVKPKGEPKETVKVCEFRIPAPGTTISFPATPGTPVCVNLDTDLSKLKVTGPGGPIPFVADPDDADIIARVPIRGGVVTPFKFKNIGIVEWSIANHSGLQITAPGGGNTYTITLKNPAPGTAAEIVLSNLHDLDEFEKKEKDDHFSLYKKLNPTMPGNLIAPRQPGHVADLSGFTSAFLKFIKRGGLADGETPGCCSG